MSDNPRPMVDIDVFNALQYTPYDAANPSGFMTPSDLPPPPPAPSLSAVVFQPGKLFADAVMLLLPINQACILPADMQGTTTEIGTPATAAAAIEVSIRQGGVWTVVGSILLQLGGAVVLPATQPVPLAPGNLLRLKAPATADATLADVAINILLLRA